MKSFVSVWFFRLHVSTTFLPFILWSLELCSFPLPLFSIIFPPFFFFFLSQLDKRWGKNTMWKCIKNKYKSLLKKSAFDLIVVCESLQVNTCRMIYMVSVLKLHMPQIQKKKRTKQKEHYTNEKSWEIIFQASYYLVWLATAIE